MTAGEGRNKALTKLRNRVSSVFIRYALSYMAVVLVLFASIMAYLYVQSAQQAREGIIDNQINRLTRIASQHEGYISAMLNTAEEIGLSPHIEPFSYDQEPWRAYDLQLQLVPYTSTNTFCDQVYLYFSGEDRLYSSSSSMTVDLFTRMMRYERVTPEALRALITGADRMVILPSQRVSSTLVDGGDPRVITFIVPLGANPGTSKGCLLFLVKDSVYKSLFADAIDGDINTYIFQQNDVLASSEDLPVPADQAALPPENGAASRVFSSGGESWTQVSLGEGSWGLRYTAVLRSADVSNAIQGRLARTFAMLLVFAALGLALALWMARRHARPIRDIKNLLGQQEDAPRRDELQQISTGIQQLTSRNMELAGRLDRALPMQRHDFIFRFMKGRFTTREEAVATARAVGLDINKACYAVILCNGPEGWEKPFEFGQPPFDTLSGISGAGVELVALKAILYLAFSDDHQALPQLAELLRRAGEAGGGRCVTAMSALHSDLTEAPAAYLEAAAAFDNRFVMGGQQVLAYAAISSNMSDILPKAEKLTHSISQAVALGNRGLLDQRINELLVFLKTTNMSPFAFRMIYNHVIDTLTRAQAAEFSSGRTAREFYDIFSLSSCQSIDDLDELLRRLCDTLMAGTDAAAEEAPGEEDEIDQVVRYMEAHFSDPEISMAAIAESFDLSTTRLSLSFKERTGMTPLDYLTLLRVEHAKGLLAKTDLTIRDISAQVGYYDSGSFIRRFKQLTGETPLQYRRAHGAEGKEQTPC